MEQWKKTALLVGAAGVAGWILSRAKRSAHRYDFSGKSILIMGASRGLGLVLARALAREGAELALCARDADELRRAADDLSALGSQALTFAGNITDPSRVSEIVHDVEAARGRIDVLINNAGIISVGPLETMTRTDFEQALANNFWGAYNAVEAALPAMRRRREGRIVNISSIGGKISVPHLLPYDVSKFALVGYSQGLRAELARHGIVVTTICPGLMRTGSPPNAFFKGQNEAEYAWFSISDSLPGLTISAEQAAAEILDACRHGDAEAVLSLPARAAVTFHGLFPGLTADILALVNRLLPGPGDGNTHAVPGKESTSVLSPSLLTALTERAARENNEIAPTEA